ncbi:ROK family protein [Acaryochloris sp. CCMEE 5410]|uniref:ROK family protein n=1 Tax=Acaryochloris sp. CCMEE 5410 TaxID=310037 RepID=UPI0002484150|nr:ROK family protein [Acaryochloris sp. CCMEE 5410]KAI9133889.1 ROK family protein [Acaryochloris sp. CCMEE 5410]
MGTPADESLLVLSVDIGGSGIKAMVLDESGQPITERQRIETPAYPNPPAVLDVIVELAKGQGDFNRVSVGFPGVVQNGVIKTAVNLNKEWIDYDLAKNLEARLDAPVRVANDADIQGYGAISGQGVELVVTLGTGFGSALFVNGHLVPNLEIAHHPFIKGKTYEQQLGRQAMKKKGKKAWNRHLAQAIQNLEHLFNYDRLYMGGGETKRVKIELPDNVEIVSNRAGILGGIALWRDRG